MHRYFSNLGPVGQVVCRNNQRIMFCGEKSKIFRLGSPQFREWNERKHFQAFVLIRIWINRRKSQIFRRRATDFPIKANFETFGGKFPYPLFGVSLVAYLGSKSCWDNFCYARIQFMRNECCRQVEVFRWTSIHYAVDWRAWTAVKTYQAVQRALLKIDAALPRNESGKLWFEDRTLKLTVIANIFFVVRRRMWGYIIMRK